MKLVRIAGTALAAAVVVAAASPLAASAKSPAPKKPVVLGTDPDNDWGTNAAAPPPAEIGNRFGQELVEASMGMADAATVNFIIKVKSLPPPGGAPEVTRYIWDFSVGEQTFELDGKYTNYTRGACDPTSGQCPPPRDPGMQPFLVRGECGPHPVATNLTVCKEVARVQAKFDSAAGTITVPVPLEAIGAGPGSKIVGAASSTFGFVLTAIPSAFVSNASMPLDGLNTTKTFVVPKK